MTEKLLRVPQRIANKATLIGVLEKLENIENILVIVQDDEGCWVMHVGDTPAERLEWMVDRAKRLIHSD